MVRYGAGSHPDAARYLVFKRSGQIANPAPANLLVFVEANPDSICRPCFGVYMDGATPRFLHIPASYHNRAGVNAFADGHVVSHRWLDERTLHPRLADFHRHDDASPNNLDLFWLRERTTSRK